MLLIRAAHLLTSVPIGLAVILVLGIPLAVVIAVLGIRAIREEQRLQKHGILADSVVIRCESRLSDSASGHRHTPYVRYIGNDGQEHEAALNLASNLPIGRKVRIKYLPGKWDYVAFVSQDLGR